MIVLDIETDGLLNKMTKIHCLSYYDLDNRIFETLFDYKDMKTLLLTEGLTIIGHNIIKFDIPAIEKILCIKIRAKLIDTLGISWYLYPERKKHGLEEWGEELGIEKPKISDWSNLTQEDYQHRCEEDVKINTKLWNKQRRFLDEIYRDESNLTHFLEYIHFKLDCVREQEEEGLTLDMDRLYSNLEKWHKEVDIKREELEQAMPQVAVFKKKKYLNAVTKDGNTFTKGDLFFQSALDSGGIFEANKVLKKIIDWDDPNSSSFVQIKDWLDSLGWVPQNIKHSRNKVTGEVKMIPQIKSRFDDGELCPSVKALFEKEPKLELLEGLFVLTHRITVLEGFKKDQIDGVIYPTMNGFTNTMRLKHKGVVNLPSVSKPYGEEIRGCIIARKGHVLIGSDLSNIEDRTKRHYIYKYDPSYVEAMNTPGYDAHLEIAVLAGFMTQEDLEFYKMIDKAKESSDFHFTLEDKKRYGILKPIRTKSKVTNFSATYKVGAPSLSRNAGISLKEAKKLLKIYWERNKAILLVEDECKIRSVGDTRWLQNPISKFWYSLRNDKDKFSTLNQGSAVYMFDMWIKEVRKLGIKVPFQYHDEILLNILEGKVEEARALINVAMVELNNIIKLNVPIGCSVEVGPTYAETH